MCEYLRKCCFFSSSHQIHLFDIDVPGKIRFQESKTHSPGCELAISFLELASETGLVTLCHHILHVGEYQSTAHGLIFTERWD